MTRTEHLLLILAEECGEVAHRASKAMRFGLDETQAGHDTNADRLRSEMIDLLAVYDMLCKEGICDPVAHDDPGLLAKRTQVENYLEYSEECGTFERT